MADQGGFNFDLCTRNNILDKKGIKSGGFLKTGTTICGVIFKVCFPFLFYIPNPTHPYHSPPLTPD
jgi:hypothetical protein